MFAAFATAYSVLLATGGATFCLIVAPLIGMHWYDWLFSGLGLVGLTMIFGVVAINTDFESSRGARNFPHGFFTLNVPPCAVLVLAVVPLTDAPVAGWLVPGIVLVIAWFSLIASVAMQPEKQTQEHAIETASTTVRATPNDHSFGPGWRGWNDRKAAIAKTSTSK